MLSLSGDGRGVAIGPQLAAFASSHGVATRLVAAAGQERVAALWAAFAAERQAPARPTLHIGDVPEEVMIDLTIILVVLDRKQPDLADVPATEATILAVAAGSATEQELARVALAVDDTGRGIDGIVVADPDQTDSTSGRHTMEERSSRPALPVRLTGVASSDAAAGGPQQEPRMNSAPWDAPDSDDDLASQDRPAATLVSLHFIRFALRRRWLACVMSAILGLLVAAAVLVAFPPAHDAKATLVLAHQPEEESSRAMATDESLLQDSDSGRSGDRESWADDDT